MFFTLVMYQAVIDVKRTIALTDGAPSRQTAMLALDIYKTFYGTIGSQGIGQAKAVIFFLLLALVSLVQLKITRKREVEA